MTRRPLVSVLVPCHNAAASLGETLLSLGRQTFDDFEIVAVDDGSTDATPAVLANRARSDSRLRVLTTPHRGIVAALCEGARYARGTYLARMDADDIALPLRFERQIRLMESNPDIAISATGVEYIPRADVRGGALRYEEWINGITTDVEIKRDLFVECPLPHPSLMLRADRYRALGGYRDMGWPEDYDLILRASEAGFTLAKIPEVLLQWREHPERLSRTSSSYSNAAFRRCKVHFLFGRLQGRPVVVWGAGRVGKPFARELRRQGHEVAAFVDLDPRKIGQHIHDTPVIPPSRAADLRKSFAVAAVGSPGAREEIREAWRLAGLKEPDQCCAVA